MGCFSVASAADVPFYIASCPPTNQPVIQFIPCCTRSPVRSSFVDKTRWLRQSVLIKIRNVNKVERRRRGQGRTTMWLAGWVGSWKKLRTNILRPVGRSHSGSPPSRPFHLLFQNAVMRQRGRKEELIIVLWLSSLQPPKVDIFYKISPFASTTPNRLIVVTPLSNSVPARKQLL